jgi:hypothetical protein
MNNPINKLAALLAAAMERHHQKMADTGRLPFYRSRFKSAGIKMAGNPRYLKPHQGLREMARRKRQKL